MFVDAEKFVLVSTTTARDDTRRQRCQELDKGAERVKGIPAVIRSQIRVDIGESESADTPDEL